MPASGTGMSVLVAVIALMAIGPGAAKAQLHGVPIWSVRVPDGNYPFVVHLVGHGTTGDDFLGDTEPDRGLVVAARKSFAERVAVTAGAGFITRDVAAGERGTRWQYFFSSSVGLKHWVHGVMPIEASVAVAGGWGRSEVADTTSEQNIPLGVEFALSLGRGGFFIDPWIAPRWHWRRTRVSDAILWQNGPAGSGGVAIKWTAWTFLASLDVVSLGAANTVDQMLLETTSLAWSIGLQRGF